MSLQRLQEYARCKLSCTLRPPATHCLSLRLAQAHEHERLQEEDAKALVAAIVAANGLELLVQRMAQFNEKLQDDATAVFNTLAIIENLVEVDPQVQSQFF